MDHLEFTTSVSAVDTYILELTFDIVERRRVDMEPLLGKPVFVPLQDPDYFARVEIDPVLGAVVWPNGADVSPEFLYWGPAGPPPGWDDREGISEQMPIAGQRR